MPASGQSMPSVRVNLQQTDLLSTNLPTAVSSMADEEQLILLKQGVEIWNDWRLKYPEIKPNLKAAILHSIDLGGINLMGANLQQADLSGANLMGADLWQANLQRANLSGAYLSQTDFSEANLSEANLSEAYLFEANLSRANLNGADARGVYLGKADLSGAYFIEANLKDVDLRGANLIGTNLSDADLSGANLMGADMQATELRRANLRQANLMGARLVKTNFEDADLSGAWIYGVACWGVNLIGAKQADLFVNHPDEPAIAADNLEVAQFIYLLSQHQKIRTVFNAAPKQIVLLLGRFGNPEILDALRQALRQQDYLPVTFDWAEPKPNLAEAIASIATKARLILADIQDGTALLPYLQQIASLSPSVPIQIAHHAAASNAAALERLNLPALSPQPLLYSGASADLALLPAKVIALLSASSSTA